MTEVSFFWQKCPFSRQKCTLGDKSDLFLVALDRSVVFWPFRWQKCRFPLFFIWANFLYIITFQHMIISVIPQRTATLKDPYGSHCLRALFYLFYVFWNFRPPTANRFQSVLIYFVESKTVICRQQNCHENSLGQVNYYNRIWTDITRLAAIPANILIEV